MKKLIAISAAVLALGVVAFVVYVYAINRPLPQNEHDVAIVERAIRLLDDESKWSRQDDRKCDAEDGTLSLYCALYAASIEITGEFRHRAAALQEVRYAIDAARPDADYAHRLMDYNNDPAVTFSDLHGMLDEALRNLQRKSGSPAE